MPHLPWSILSLVLSLLNLTRMSYIFSDCPHLDPVRTSQPNRGNVFSHKFKIFKRKYAQMYLSTSRWFVIRQEHIHTHISPTHRHLSAFARGPKKKKKKKKTKKNKRLILQIQSLETERSKFNAEGKFIIFFVC